MCLNCVVYCLWKFVCVGVYGVIVFVYFVDVEC